MFLIGFELGAPPHVQKSEEKSEVPPLFIEIWQSHFFAQRYRAFARCWGPLIPTRLRRGWTGYAGPAPATPDSAPVDCPPTARVRPGRLPSIFFVTCELFFVTCEHSSGHTPRHALFRNMRALFWTRVTTLFFVTCEHSETKTKSACLLRKKLVDGQTHAELPWVRAEEPQRSPEYPPTMADADRGVNLARVGVPKPSAKRCARSR